jgi:uncharacterized protein YjbJ (UPF0337 family)
MDWNRVEGNWKEVKGKIKQKWGQLTDDDLAQINGRRDQLEGKIQQRYGLAKDLVRKDVDDWLDAQPWLIGARGSGARSQILSGGTGNRPKAISVGNLEIKENVMSSESPERRPVISARQARQGVTGHNVRLVLSVSLAAIVIVFAIIWMVYFA